jgi:cytochrome c553
LLACLAGLSTPAAQAQSVPDAAALYRQHCATCHGEQRTGGMGPALLPESLERLRPAEAQKVIAAGRVATQMPAFGATLSAEEIGALSAWIRTPVMPAPRWREDDIRTSRVATPLPPDTPAVPVWSADPMNLFVVVEGGDHHVSLVDGDCFEVIERFASRFALHGGRAEVHAGRPLRLLRLARRLDHQVRPVAAPGGRRGARRAEHAQCRGQRRRALGHGGQLPAAHARAVRRRPEPGAHL